MSQLLLNILSNVTLPPYPSVFVQFKHIFVTHPAKISVFHNCHATPQNSERALGAQTEIFVKFMSKTLVAFAILKPSTVVPIFSSDIYTMIVLHSLRPLPMPLKIYFYVKPMLSRLMSPFHSFYNTMRLESSDTIMPATTINY